MDDRVTGQDVAATVGGQPMNGTSESTRPIPRATYRIQFNKDFGFRQAAELVPYLARLGISHLYASPYLKARPGSTHGYDIIDHNALNPELGTKGNAGMGIGMYESREFIRQLRRCYQLSGEQCLLDKKQHHNR